MDITFRLETLTLGEMAQVEEASGKTFRELMRTSSGRLTMALFIHELRNSDRPRSWNELLNLRLLDVSSSTLLSDSTEIPAR